MMDDVDAIFEKLVEARDALAAKLTKLDAAITAYRGGVPNDPDDFTEKLRSVILDAGKNGPFCPSDLCTIACEATGRNIFAPMIRGVAISMTKDGVLREVRRPGEMLEFALKDWTEPEKPTRSSKADLPRKRLNGEAVSGVFESIVPEVDANSVGREPSIYLTCNLFPGRKFTVKQAADEAGVSVHTIYSSLRRETPAGEKRLIFHKDEESELVVSSTPVRRAIAAVDTDNSISHRISWPVLDEMIMEAAKAGQFVADEITGPASDRLGMEVTRRDINTAAHKLVSKGLLKVIRGGGGMGPTVWTFAAKPMTSKPGTPDRIAEIADRVDAGLPATSPPSDEPKLAPRAPELPVSWVIKAVAGIDHPFNATHLITKAKKAGQIADHARVLDVLRQLTERRIVRILSFASGKREAMYERIEDAAETIGQTDMVTTAVEHRGEAPPLVEGSGNG